MRNPLTAYGDNPPTETQADRETFKLHYLGKPQHNAHEQTRYQWMMRDYSYRKDERA